jgi:Regulator of ribonuclease activity B
MRNYVRRNAKWRSRVNDTQRSRATAILARQVAMNRQTFAALQQAGLKPQSEVQLDFTFVAPDEERALALRSLLEQNDCIGVSAQKRPGLFSKKYTVTGKSAPTNLTIEVLDQWVQWMVVQGLELDCEFDGWGTSVPR